uniref:Uncharacterized protein n=1 Tax=Anguilla anguilla TaxID=7936 RepID=A0A0E9PV26_ANGAN
MRLRTQRQLNEKTPALFTARASRAFPELSERASPPCHCWSLF